MSSAGGLTGEAIPVAAQLRHSPAAGSGAPHLMHLETTRLQECRIRGRLGF
jgi:hypothetical protein